MLIFICWLSCEKLSACDPERIAQSPLFRAIRQAKWIDEGRGYPNSVNGISRWNSDCKPSITADGKYLYFLSGTNNGPPYSNAHIGNQFNMYVAR